MSDAVLPPDVLRHITRGESELLADMLLGWNEAARRALVPALVAHVRSINPWRPDAGPLFVAGAACLSTAVQTAAWFARSVFRQVPGGGDGDAVVRQAIQVLLARDVAWYDDLARRVASGLTYPRDAAMWPLAAGLITISGAPIPTDDAFVLGWLHHCVSSSESAYNRFFYDPLTDVLAPRVFDIDRSGRLLNVRWWTEAPRIGHTRRVYHAWAALTTAGRLDRRVILAGTLMHLIRGDDRESVHAFAQLHDELQPTVAESRDHVGDYLRLLQPDKGGPLATLAQRVLRQIDEAGPLEPAQRLEMSETILTRPEKAIVRSQLSWIAATARHSPATASSLVSGVAIAFSHPASDIQDRAVTIAIAHVDCLTASDRARITDALEVLDRDVHARAAGVFGSASTDPPPNDEPVVASITTPAMPPPIETAAALAAAAVTYLATRTEDLDPIEMERILDGLIRLSYADMNSVIAAIQPLKAAYPDRLHAGDRPHFSSPGYLTAALFAPLGETPLNPATTDADLPYPEELAPTRVLAARLREITTRLRAAPVPFLLATPTTRAGHINAAMLVDRLAAYESARIEPWPYDLEQALLRVYPDTIATAHTLGSPAGRMLTCRITDGPPAARATRVLIDRERSSLFQSWGNDIAAWTRPGVAIAADLPDAGPLTRALLTLEPAVNTGYGTSKPLLRVWPALAPSHREAIAAHALRHIARIAEEDAEGPGSILPLLAQSSGPAGPAISLALAYGLGARHLPDRTAAIDAFIHLAATGDLDPSTIGEDIGATCTDGKVVLNRVVTALTEIARIGYGPQVGRVALAALTEPLAQATPPVGTPALLQLAAKHHTPGATVTIAPLAEISARPNTNRLVTEARRLQRILATPTSANSGTTM